MLKNTNNLSHGLFVAFILFITIIPNYFFNTGSMYTSYFGISIGLSIGFYFQYSNKIIPYIISSIFLSHLISRIIFANENNWDSLIIAVVFTVIIFVVSYVMRKIIISFKLENTLNFRASAIFFIGALIVSVFAGSMIAYVMSVVKYPDNILDIFYKWSSAYFFGILIFGSTMLMSYYYEENRNSVIKNYVFGGGYLSLFILVTSLLFSGTVSWFTFENHAYILIVFYLFLSFSFPYRMILISNIFFVFIYQFFIIKLGGNEDFTYFSININLYLLTLSSTSSIVKSILYKFKNKNEALIKSTSKLEKLVYSTESLLKLSDDILNTDIKIQEDYLSRIFKIACNIFENYDYASCYIKEDPYVNFVAAVGYDVETLMSYKFESSKIDFIDTEMPTHIADENNSVFEALENKYDDFVKVYPRMSESIRFGIYIDENTIGGISFDISEESGKRFMIEEFESLKSFQKLMNSFFSINYLNYKNISLKNDIVLSLIRTLELFDQYTGGHSEEVAHLSREIAERCNLNDYQKHDIYWAGVVHDIGKVGIDSNIINKPSKLSLEEYEAIKEHSMFGYEILNKAEDLKNIAILVKHHHEWWNGEGYPSGLKGEEIPLGSQIISVCDAVSTMAKQRPYTIVKTSREIIDELEMYSGVQFSPLAAKKMIDYIKEGYLDDYYKRR